MFNLVTQDNLVYAEKKYLEQSITAMWVKARTMGISDIGMPAIGCGLGGLTLVDLKQALRFFIEDSGHHVTIWHLPFEEERWLM